MSDGNDREGVRIIVEENEEVCDRMEGSVVETDVCEDEDWRE